MCSFRYFFVLLACVSTNVFFVRILQISRFIDYILHFLLSCRLCGVSFALILTLRRAVSCFFLYFFCVNSFLRFSSVFFAGLFANFAFYRLHIALFVYFLVLLVCYCLLRKGNSYASSVTSVASLYCLACVYLCCFYHYFYACRFRFSLQSASCYLGMLPSRFGYSTCLFFSHIFFC